MPRRTQHSRRGGRRRGGSFKSFIKGANNFLKKSGLLSTLGNLGSQIVPGKWGERIGKAGKVAGTLGYGRRRRRKCGGALRPAGGGPRRKMTIQDVDKMMERSRW